MFNPTPATANPEDPSPVNKALTQHHRRREWNRGPLQDLFPRIPAPALETLLDICVSPRKNFVYNLSESRRWNARRYTGIVVAHVRHAYTEYDRLVREEGVERFAARRRTAAQVWRVLRAWCPWDESNEVLEAGWRVTLVRPEDREPGWDPMDVDDDDEVESDGGNGDPMDLD